MSHKEYHNVEDFLIDSTFQKYCSGGDVRCIAFWERYIASHPEQHETISRAKRLFHILAGHKKSVDKQVDNLKRNVSQLKEHQNASVFRFSTWWKVAAVFVILGISYMWITNRPDDQDADLSRHVATAVVSYETKKGEKKRIELSDGTKVSLNSASRLEVEQAFNDRERHVHLVGEAYFEVEKDSERPFILHTSDFDIKVLGTSFNVKSYPDDASSEALLVEGVIEMRSKDKNENSIVVKPNQKVTIYKDNKLTVNKAEEASKKQETKVSVKEIAIQEMTESTDLDSNPDIAWRENRLEVVDQDFASLEKVLERWYDVDITLHGDKIKNYRFTATFSKENIEQVLSALQKVEHFNYKIYGNNIKIYEK